MPFFDHYPYTNLHNVNLDWVLQAVKSWGAMVEQNNQNFIDLNAANEAFKEYVTGYITNLDVQEEINNKLDDMLASGELVPYLSPYITSAVDEWLGDNITPTTPALDATLTLANAAAQAKATGDRIRALEDAPAFTVSIVDKLEYILRHALYDIDTSATITSLVNELLGTRIGPLTGFIQGTYISTPAGGPSINTSVLNRASRSSYQELLDGDVIGFSDPSAYDIYSFAASWKIGGLNWNATGATNGYSSQNFTITVPAVTWYIMIKKNDDSNMTSEDIAYINRTFGIIEEAQE